MEQQALTTYQVLCCKNLYLIKLLLATCTGGKPLYNKKLADLFLEMIIGAKTKGAMRWSCD